MAEQPVETETDDVDVGTYQEPATLENEMYRMSPPMQRSDSNYSINRLESFNITIASADPQQQN